MAVYGALLQNSTLGYPPGSCARIVSAPRCSRHRRVPASTQGSLKANNNKVRVESPLLASRRRLSSIGYALVNTLHSTAPRSRHLCATLPACVLVTLAVRLRFGVRNDDWDRFAHWSTGCSRGEAKPCLHESGTSSMRSQGPSP